MKFSRYHFFDKILEISLVFTHGITPAWVNRNRCFVKNASWCSLQCTGILLVIEEGHTGILPQGVPPTQTSIFCHTIRCTGCRAMLQNVKKNSSKFFKTCYLQTIKTARGIYFEWSMIYFYWYMYIKTRVFIFQSREQVLFYYFGSIATHGPAHW